MTTGVPGSDFESGAIDSLPLGWGLQKSYEAKKDKGSSEYDARLTDEASFKGRRSLFLYVKVMPPATVLKDPSLPMEAQFAATKGNLVFVY